MDKLLKDIKQFPITMSVIMICIFVYIVSTLLFGIEMNTEQAIMFGGYNPLYVFYNHDYYRLITANFIHFGLIHICVNCYSIYGIGRFLESSLKFKKYLIVIIVSAIATTLLPYCLFLVNGFEANTISGGVSGVIFGLIGSLGALALRYKNIFMDVFKQLAPSLMMMLVLSLVVPSISLSGHVSGLIGGFVVTYIIIRKPKAKKTNPYDDLLN